MDCHWTLMSDKIKFKIYSSARSNKWPDLDRDYSKSIGSTLELEDQCTCQELVVDSPEE